MAQLLLNRFATFIQEDTNYIWFDDLMSYLHEGKDKIVPSKVLRSFKRKNGEEEHISVNGKIAIPSFSLLRYIFQRAEVSQPCTELCKVVNDLVKDNATRSDVKTDNKGVCKPTKTVLDLYKEIAKLDIFKPLSATAGVKVSIDENDIRTLFPSYKKNFSQEQWFAICIFEKHFHQHLKNERPQTFEEELENKWSVWLSCKEAYNVGRVIHPLVQATIDKRIKRKNVAHLQKQCIVQAAQFHNPDSLESGLLGSLKARAVTVNSVIVVDHEDSPKINALTVFVEAASSL